MMMNWIISVLDIIFLVCVLVSFSALIKSIGFTNIRIDGIHERIDTLRDFMMQKQENELSKIDKRIKDLG